MLGRKLMMKFTVSCKLQWFKGIVNAYEGLTGKYGVYFPCDKQTVNILEDDKDIVTAVLVLAKNGPRAKLGSIFWSGRTKNCCLIWS